MSIQERWPPLMHPGDSGFLGALYYLILAYFTLFLLGAEAGPPIPLSDAAGHFAGMDEWAMGGGGGLYGLEYPGMAWNSLVFEPTTAAVLESCRRVVRWTSGLVLSSRGTR